ncbi:ribosomal protein RSM22 (predicted rRNA methylase) [Bradyrhizobium sp. LM6.9]
MVASYVIGELREGDRRKLAETMWAKARHALVVIEPGTPAGYARILALRQQLITAGAYVAAPCPHEKPCPLMAPDWCHFSQRLPRSQAHRQIKGADVPFEDERFIYVALTRTPPAARAARVLAPPDVGKAEITAKLCTEQSVELARIPRRDKAAYASARRWRWGDAVMSES